MKNISNIIYTNQYICDILILYSRQVMPMGEIMQNKANFKRKPIVKETVAAEGAVVGRNALRELLASGRDIDKIFVLRGEREGSITLLVAKAIERGIPVVEVERAKLGEYFA